MVELAYCCDRTITVLHYPLLADVITEMLNGGRMTVVDKRVRMKSPKYVVYSAGSCHVMLKCLGILLCIGDNHFLYIDTWYWYIDVDTVVQCDIARVGCSIPTGPPI
jgi:hypothetical protein